MQPSGLPSYIKVGSTYVHNLSPLGGIFKPGITKAGRVSLTGQLCNGEKVKVYSCLNSNQVMLRVYAENKIRTDDVCFPPIVSFDGQMIIEKWIDTNNNLSNKKTSHENLESLMHFLSYLHCFSSENILPSTYAHSFCYLKDYLVARLHPWKNWEPISRLLDAWHHEDDVSDKVLFPRLSHPDLSISNIVIGKDLKMYIIDNELFGFGKGWVLDHYNTNFRSTFIPDDVNKKCKPFVELSWKLRLAGSALDSGDFYRAERMARI